MAEQLAYSVLEPLKDNASELYSLSYRRFIQLQLTLVTLTINTKGCCDCSENSAHKQSDYKVIMQVL